MCVILEIKDTTNQSIGYELKKLKPDLEVYTPDNDQELNKMGYTSPELIDI